MVIYYYKTKSGRCRFKTDTEKEFEDESEGMEYLVDARRNGYGAYRLYLDIPEDFERIKRLFHTPEYWDKTSWYEELEK